MNKNIVFFLLLIFMMSAEQSLAQSSLDNTIANSTAEQKFNTFINDLTPTEQSALAKRINREDKIANNPYGILLYEPTYILPFYYTMTPDTQVYQSTTTPGNQSVMSAEFKMQFSFQVPIMSNFLGANNSLNMAYTQDSFWQAYADSPYFRETNYAPEIFFRRLQNNNFSWQLGLLHQSNGRGGEYERAWNRAYGEATYSGTNWVVALKPWVIILESKSADLYNPDIGHYLGYGETKVFYKMGSTTLSFMTRNNAESHFTRGAEELTLSFPIHGHFRGYVYGFSGYGQSLIEYNHYTNAFGIGIAFNDWI